MTRYNASQFAKAAEELKMEQKDLKKIVGVLKKHGVISVPDKTAVTPVLKMSQEKLIKLACYDSLTGLPNEFLFNDRITYLIASSKREKKSFGVMFIDIDNFKSVNDTYGHQIGDKILNEIGAILKSSVRTNDLVSRLHGDEFAIILDNISVSDTIIDLIGTKILSRVKDIKYDGKPLQISASIGVSFYPNDGNNVRKLIAAADQAMYQAKKNGKSEIKIFNSSRK